MSNAQLSVVRERLSPGTALQRGDGAVPVDLDAALALPDWRERLWWPIGIAEANRLCAAQVRAALQWVAGLEGGLPRDSALLALPNILGRARALILLALAVQRAAKAQTQLLGAAPELDYLRSGQGPPSGRVESILPPAEIRFELARRVARVHSWCSPWRAFAAFTHPDAVAISHCPLLRSAAAREQGAIGFRHAEQILRAARRHAPMDAVYAHDGEGLASVLVDGSGIEEPYHGRVLALLRAMAEPQLAHAASDMAALHGARLPETIWATSGGVYAPRAIGLEVLRRGGRVVRFDHGKPKGFVEAAEIDALVEFAVSSDFVLATQGAAAVAHRYGNKAVLSWMKHPRMIGAAGDPTFARLPPLRHRHPNPKPRVVYAPTQLLGFRQLLPVQQPDVLYLNWQMEVAEALCELPVELICQPHPEGFFRNHKHPLESIAPTRRSDFTAELARADVLVFDYPSTTALWEAACTDARIVFLDMGAGAMTPEIATLFNARARVLKVEHDEGNRPLLDKRTLRDAVLDTSGPVDPMPLRRLLAGAER